MCNCVNVEVGTYDNTVLLGYYEVMRQYRDNRVAAGLSGDGICVDKCIADQVIELWEGGVRTYGSCCGHNKQQGFINVDPDDMEKAISLGYEVLHRDVYAEREDSRPDTVKTKQVMGGKG